MASLPVPDLPACAAADLSLRFDGRNGAFDGMGHGGSLMVVRNLGDRPCRVTALPSLSFAGPDGAALPVRFRPPPGDAPGPAVPPVVIAPGAVATAALRYVSADVHAPGRCFHAATIRVSFGEAELTAPSEPPDARQAGTASLTGLFDPQGRKGLRMASDTTFKLSEALEAQQAMRDALGLEEEIFPVQAFVGMVSDEIEASRKAGYDDQSISDLIQRTTGKTVSAEDIRKFYATPEERQKN